MTQPKDGEGAEALRKALESLIDPLIVNNIDNRWFDIRLEAADLLAIRRALAPPATPVRGGGGEELSVSQSQPCGEATADAEVFAGLAAEPSAARRPSCGRDA